MYHNLFSIFGVSIDGFVVVLVSKSVKNLDSFILKRFVTITINVVVNTIFDLFKAYLWAAKETKLIV